MLQTRALTQAPIIKTLTLTSLPNIVGLLALIGSALIDTLFVSWISTQALTAVSYTFVLVLFVGAIAKGLGTALSAHYGRAIGKQNTTQARRLFDNAILMTWLISSLVAVAGLWSIAPLFGFLGASSDVLPLIRDYMMYWYLGVPLLMLIMVGNKGLRCLGDAKTPAKVMLAAAAINTILDPILIFGLGPAPELGIAGASIATTISWAAALAWSAIHWRKDAQWLEPCNNSWRKLCLDWRRFIAIAQPSSLTALLQPAVNTGIIAVLARLDESAVAAFGVAVRIESFLLIGVNGLATALAPFIAANLGAGQKLRAHSALMQSLFGCLAIQALVVLPVVLFATPIARVFSDDPQVVHWLSFYLKLVPLAYGFLGVVILFAQALNAYRKPLQALTLNLSRTLLIMIPLMIIGQSMYGVAGLLLALPLANALAGGVSLFLAWRMR
ncbi:MATE family efflux transporter [Paraferrimonas sedimenticola]|uniref:MATE family efflux transporter n=1 Tax=Paraferrimonas sedimenticola TaxID=375674 RepID=A0AA37W123_9GAMM|nr:MATE family efflux transporter [Paraferrimonas sedimenticola]GLP95757.1 MATE family efflux transporter [Paraferrimonas sedimenticola]